MAGWDDAVWSSMLFVLICICWIDNGGYGFCVYLAEGIDRHLLFFTQHTASQSVLWSGLAWSGIFCGKRQPDTEIYFDSLPVWNLYAGSSDGMLGISHDLEVGIGR